VEKIKKEKSIKLFLYPKIGELGPPLSVDYIILK
jgi:hypothetical protein